MHVIAVGEGEDVTTTATRILRGAPPIAAAGGFVLRQVAPGSGQLQVMAPASNFEPLVEQVYTVTEGQDLDVGVLTP